MSITTAQNSETMPRTEVKSAVGYYSLFAYPVLPNEILGSMSQKCTLPVLMNILQDLVDASEIYSYDGYYCTLKEVQSLVKKRKAANQLAVNYISRAKKAGEMIDRFPFVRFVGISGSLSKGYADQQSDFDFFIVAEKDRLWICRTLLHLFKKLTFLVGKQHEFCMNYFVDSNELEIDEKNRYTAIELESIIPVTGKATYNQVIDANEWVRAFLPNGYHRFDKGEPREQDSIMKKIIESGFNMFFPDAINRKLMRMTDKKWRKKWAKRNYPMGDYEMAFKTTLHVSKNHPANHLKKVMAAVSEFEK